MNPSSYLLLMERKPKWTWYFCSEAEKSHSALEEIESFTYSGDFELEEESLIPWGLAVEASCSQQSSPCQEQLVACHRCIASSSILFFLMEEGYVEMMVKCYGTSNQWFEGQLFPFQLLLPHSAPRLCNLCFIDCCLWQGSWDQQLMQCQGRLIESAQLDFCSPSTGWVSCGAAVKLDLLSPCRLESS